ncbi:MAG: T9SS type A sorting domain-containing protein [Alphaproteobacteria bacterium]|nr:T9SS type A sorting domain-containing protein [Alphaproteobacteria bacterium]
MITSLRILFLFMLPCMMYSQSEIYQLSYPPQTNENSSRTIMLKPEVTDLTIAPDSVYFTKGGALKAVFEILNNSNQPINLLHVQSQCAPCVGGWGWWVDSISVTTPHYIYPGQHITVIMKYWAQIKDEFRTNFLHDSMYIVSSVGTQYCHIFLDPDLISSTGTMVTNDFMVFPNPATSTVKINLSANFSGHELLSIYNSKGIKIKELELNTVETEINMNWVPDGIYLFKITDGSILRIRRVLKLSE